MIQICANNIVFFTLKITIHDLLSSFSMLFVNPCKTCFFSFLVFLLYNDVCFKYKQPYKKDGSQRTQRLIRKLLQTDSIY